MTGADTIKDLPREAKRCPECGTGFGVEAAFCPFDGVALKKSTWDPSGDRLTGAVVDRRYEVVGPLGEGGMGTVYKVRHIALDRLFAMKVLRHDLAKDPGLARRFMQEARATAAIHHPSVVAITDFGELADGAPYYVMELLVGETLATYMRARGVLAPRVAASIARKLAEALFAAHQASVVHRDLKPENVFLVGAMAGKSAADEVRVVDFGAAKIMGGSKLTRPGVVFGTPHYMSPEQASGEPVDARSDIYSLGVLLYEMITGAVPFEADTYMGVLTKHMFAAPVKPSERVTGVQLGSLEDIVLRALEKDPSARYASMSAFSSALQLASAEATSAPRLAAHAVRPVGFSQMSTADRIESSVTRHIATEARLKRRFAAIATVVAAAGLGATALVITLVQGAPNDTSQATSALAIAPPVASSAPPSPPAAASPSASAVSSSAATSAVSSASAGVSAPPSPRPRALPASGSTPSARAAPAPQPQPFIVRPAPGDDFADPWKR